jgi:hypothetical protein
MKDAELLDKAYGSCQELRSVARSQAIAEFAGPLVDDLRWLSPFPLQPDLQLRHLYLQGLDALDVAAVGLRSSTSSAAVGAVRLVAECCVLVKWLTEHDGPERRERAYRLAMDGIKRTRRMRSSSLGPQS